MGLIIFDGDTSTYVKADKNKNNEYVNDMYVIANKNNDTEKIDLITVNEEPIKEKIKKEIKHKTSRKNKKDELTKENREFLDSLIKGSGFKKIPPVKEK